jgi:uncharacterized protein (TIGR02594 family)
MRHGIRIMFAASCAGLFVASAPALSLPAPQRAPALVVEARKYMGTNPTDRKRLWCATFMNFVLARLGYDGTHSDAAQSFAYYGRRISSPRVGAIAVLRRGRNGGHVGVVTGIDSQGNPIVISGNHNDRVGEGIYPRSRVIAYVMPTERHPVTTQLAARSFSAPVSAKGIDSPITELIAAIEAEHARAQRTAEGRQRLLQQRQPAPSHNDFSLDPLLTKLFGPDDRVAPHRLPPPPQPRAKTGHRLAVR